MIIDGSHYKGDVFAKARIAGIQEAKRTWELIPLCHPLLLSKVEVHLEAQPQHHRVRIETCCRLSGNQRLFTHGDHWVLALELGKLLMAADHPLRAGDEVAFFPPVTGG